MYWVPDDTHAQVHPSPQYVGFNTSYDPGHHQAVNSPPTSATPFHAAPAESFCSGYKPTALRWWYHLLLIICLAGFIGLTEYAIRNLAVYNNDAVSKMIHARSVDQIFSRMTSFVDVHLHLDRPRQEASGDVTIATAPTTPDQLTTATNPAQDTPSAAVAASTAPDVEVTSPVPIPTDDGKGVQGQTTVTSPETTPTQVTTSLRPGDGGLVGETTISAPSVPTTTDDGAGLQDETSVSLPPALTPTNEGDGVQVQTTQTATVTDPNAGIQTKTTTDGGAGVVSQTTVKVGATPDPNAGMVGSTTLSATVAFTTGSGGLATETTLTDDTNDVAGATGLVVGQNIRTSLTNNVAVTPTVAVVQQTTVVPASEANVVMTRTAANGAVIQETVKTFIPAQTNVLSQSITVNRGQVLTTMSTVSAVVGGGTTQVLATTSTDANGRVTSFSHTTVIGGTTSSATMQLVFATTPSAADRNANVKVLTTSDAEYITGAFLATILAVLMSFPLRLIGINAKLMQPFNTLARASTVRGAAAQHSVFLRYYDWTGAFSFFLAIRDGQPVVAISDTLSLLAGLLSPVAATTASIHVDDGCTSHCFGSLGISVGPGRALQALLGLIMALLAVLILIIGVLRWETGVNQNPWSIAGMASLCRDPELRERLMRLPRGMSGCVSEGDVLRILRQRSYALGCFWQPQGASSPRVGYGVMVAGTGDATCQFLRPDDERVCPEAESSSRVRKCQPFAVLTWWGRSGILFLYSSVLILVTYYGTTGGDTGFERFMDSQTYGVKFLFTGIGVVLGITMNTFFRCEYPPLPLIVSWTRNPPLN